jgi:diacylglycerol kinase (ATP)
MNKILQERWNSFKYAINGIKLLFSTQIHGKFHLFFGIFVVVAGYFFDISTTEWCFVTLSIAMVIAAEAFNTSLEKLTDLVSPDYHPLAGQAKDLAAGAVLICALGTIVIGFIIFLPKVIMLFY